MSQEDPVILGRSGDAALTDQLLSPVWTPRGKGFWGIFLIALALAFVLLLAIGATVVTGVGLWGNNIPVGWAFGIINFVFWIGIGHAGTFISAILLLLEQPWRTSINRFSEGMTIFAVVQAGLFPLLHLGRPWFGYWLIPYPATMQMWPQFRSALPWDAAAVGTYFTLSLLFWYVGLIPDFASLREVAPDRARRIVFGVLALGWRGSARHLRHYRVLYGLLAGIATPLVLSVHSVVSTDFAMALLPGWHSTIFPPFFVAGAIFSGFAMVVTLMVPVRRVYRLHNVITDKHLDALGKMMLTTGWIVVYSYVIETVVAWYSGSMFERDQFFRSRPFGPNAAIFWVQMVCNALVVQLLWIPRVRRSPVILWLVSIAINLGMWSERFVIIVMGLQQDFLPSSWRSYSPTVVDWALFAGTGGFFLVLFLLFLRHLPFIATSEVKELAHELRKEER